MSTPSTNPESSANLTPFRREDARSLVDRILDDAPDTGFSARSALDKHPQLEQFPSCVIDLAYEEYCRAREAGNPIAASEFVERFSTIQQSLYRVIEFDQVLHEHPSLVEEVPNERWPKVGAEFQGLKLLEQLGRGALSRVFLARHIRLGNKHVVVKICIRGEREAELLGQLAHPNIGEVHSIEIDAATGLAAICMPYETRLTMHQLAEWLCLNRQQSKKRVSATEIHRYVEECSQCEGIEETAAGIREPILRRDNLEQLVVKWGIQLAGALRVAHANEVLHCDVKPGNVLILPDLSSRLLDFNLATSEHDRSLLMGGTLPYMAPEQLRGLLQTDAQQQQSREALNDRTDVYGLCATLWHIAMGRPPFGSSLDSPSRRQCAEDMLERVRGGICIEDRKLAEQRLSRGVVDLLVKGMSFDRADRHESAVGLEQALKSKVRKDRRPVYLGLLIALLVSLAFVVLIPRYRDVSAVSYVQSAEQYEAGDFFSAEATIFEYRFDDDRSKVLHLATRTAQLPSPEHLSHVVGAEQPNLSDWHQVYDEWRHLEQTTECPDVCRFNAYLAKLEFMSAYEDKIALILDTFESPIGMLATCDRQIQLMKVLQQQTEGKFSNFDELAGLVETTAQGTRGEFILLFEAVADEWMANRSDEVATLMDTLLKCLAKPSPIAEGRVARIWLLHPGRGKIPAKELADKLMKLKNAGGFNQLGEFLKLAELSEIEK